MTTIRTIVAAAAVLALTTAAAPAQEPGAGPFGRGGRGQGPFPGGRIGGPVRDNAEQPVGTARIRGRVMSADAGSPVRRAQIRVTSREAGINKEVASDSEGRYEILSLPAGRYRLYVSKAGYVTLEHGQARPFEAGKPLDLADGQSLDDLDFALPRGSVITGRITDEFGDPITDVLVQAMRYQFANGERQLVNAGRASTTDDLGQFRIFGLMPGDYVVRASVRGQNASPSPATPDGPLGYPGTYYPGVVDVSQAQAVTVALGQELTSVAFPLVPSRLATISGTVVGSAGQPLGGAAVVLRAAGAAGGARMNLSSGTMVRQDGTFRLPNVSPGEYLLDVQQRPRNVQSLQALELSQIEFASMPLSVSGDIDNLTVVTTTGATVSGRVVFQGPAAQKATPLGIQMTALTPSGQPSIRAFAGRALGGGRVNADGTFELRGLSGQQIIRATGLPAGWALKAISLDGADITDAPFDFRPGSRLNEIVVTLTDRVAEVSGAVRDARGHPVADYVLIVFPEDGSLWGGQSRYIATARPSQNGTFAISGLPPARYLAAVVPSLENGLQHDPAVLAQLRPIARSFTLAEGQTLSLNLEMPPQ